MLSKIYQPKIRKPYQYIGKTQPKKLNDLSLYFETDLFKNDKGTMQNTAVYVQKKENEFLKIQTSL